MNLDMLRIAHGMDRVVTKFDSSDLSCTCGCSINTEGLRNDAVWHLIVGPTFNVGRRRSRPSRQEPWQAQAPGCCPDNSGFGSLRVNARAGRALAMHKSTTG